ncbi:MAG: hypothetical protein WKF75_10525, partial [Singulisphaera sp.]
MQVDRAPRMAVVMGMAVVVGVGVVVPASVRALQPGTTPKEETSPPPEAGAIKGWQKGKGWGWIWGKDDEVGALNAMTDATRAAALATARRGETFDLGMTYSRRSFKWPGHS